MEYPHVEMDFMNRDHAEFAELREKLLTSLAKAESQNEVITLLNTLFTHTQAHFGEENRLMEATGFPPYPIHKNEHDSVLADMAMHIENWKNDYNPAQIRDWLTHDLADWFVSHVSTMDFVTARFISTAQNEG